jgi:hypothetical protein
VKVAVVDRTGKLLDTATIYPHVPRNDWDGALARWRRWQASTASSWSRSATAPPRARPTSWPPT